MATDNKIQAWFQFLMQIPNFGRSLASTTTQQQLAHFPSLNAYYRSWGVNQSIIKSNCYQAEM